MMYKLTIQNETPEWPDKTVYFLTDSTFLHFPYFKTEEQKQIVLNQIKKINTALGIPVSDYSIAVNHLHIKFYLERGSDLAKVKQLLRGGISFAYKKRYDARHSEIWQTRKIYCVYSEDANWKISGYIIGNLLKHKEVGTFEELKQNEFTSYRYMAEKYGEELMQELVRSVIDVKEDAWGVVNLGQLKNIKIKQRC